MDAAKRAGKEKPRYNMLKTSAWMVKMAREGNQTIVPVVTFAVGILAFLASLTELLITPAILSRIEAAVPLDALVYTIAGFTAALLVLRAARSWLQRVVQLHKVDARTWLLRKITLRQLTASFPLTEDVKAGGKLQRALNAVQSNISPTEAVWETLSDLLTNVLGFAVYLLLLSSADPLLIVISLLTSVTAYFAGRHLRRWSWRHREEYNRYTLHWSYFFKQAEDVHLAKDLHIFGMDGWLRDIRDAVLRALTDFAARQSRHILMADVLDAFLAFARNGIAYAYLIGMTLKRGLPASQFLLYFTAVSGFTVWVTGILTKLVKLQQDSEEISLVREYLELPEPFLFEEGEPLHADQLRSCELTLEHVSFRYPEAEEDTIHDMNLTLRPGEKLALVGLNGAGKTTLVKLLCGLYDPTEGRVLLNGRDIRAYNRRDYYTLFSAVFQQFFVLDATLAENVSQAVGGGDRERVKRCLELAGLTKTVEKLPAGLDTHIGRRVYEDGVELSGGETQRLLLARALYKDAPVILLDEPTAALDPLAESDLYHRYAELTAGRTSLYISHRLASTRFCDRVIYLKDGSIMEQGTHEELLAMGGEYAHLFDVQSQYYREGGEGHV